MYCCWLAGKRLVAFDNNWHSLFCHHTVWQSYILQTVTYTPIHTFYCMLTPSSYVFQCVTIRPGVMTRPVLPGEISINTVLIHGLTGAQAPGLTPWKGPWGSGEIYKIKFTRSKKKKKSCLVCTGVFCPPVQHLCSEMETRRVVFVVVALLPFVDFTLSVLLILIFVVSFCLEEACLTFWASHPQIPNAWPVTFLWCRDWLTCNIWCCLQVYLT